MFRFLSLILVGFVVSIWWVCVDEHVCGFVLEKRSWEVKKERKKKKKKKKRTQKPSEKEWKKEEEKEASVKGKRKRRRRRS